MHRPVAKDRPWINLYVMRDIPVEYTTCMMHVMIHFLLHATREAAGIHRYYCVLLRTMLGFWSSPNPSIIQLSFAVHTNFRVWFSNSIAKVLKETNKQTMNQL